MLNHIKPTIMKHVILKSIVLTAGLLTLSCEKEDWNNSLKVSGQGEIVTQPLNLNPFTQINLEGVANLHITIGDEESALLKAQQNIIDVLTWEVSSGTLTIGLKPGVTIHNHEEIRFELKTMVMSRLVHEGVGEVNLVGTVQDALEFDFRGVGNVFAYGLPVDNVLVLNGGTGDCKVRAIDYLEVDLSSVGNVHYRGNPEISCTKSGLGELINDN
jgi:hypothetical protein